MQLDKEELKKCPNVLSKEQLIKVGHMSKRTASYLLESKLLPSKNNGKKTRCYEIKKKDVIAFFNDYSVMPEKYATPPKWYSERKQIRTRPFRLRFSADNYDDRMLHSYYKRRLAISYSGVLTLAYVRKIQRYSEKVHETSECFMGCVRLIVFYL